MSFGTSDCRRIMLLVHHIIDQYTRGEAIISLDDLKERTDNEIYVTNYFDNDGTQYYDSLRSFTKIHVDGNIDTLKDIFKDFDPNQ